MDDILMKERIKGMMGAIAFHLILILFLIFTYMKPFQAQRTSQAAEGIPVMFGNVEDTFGIDDPKGLGAGTTDDENIDVSVPAPAVEPKAGNNTPSNATTKEPVKAVTQNHTKTVEAKTDAEKKADEKRRADADAAQREKAEAAKQAQLEAEQIKNVDNVVKGALGKGAGGGKNRGNTEGNGVQGSPTGNNNAGATSGIGGIGTSFALANRNPAGAGLIKPTYPPVNTEGIVVVNIIVNPSGTVISANPSGKGTNTANSALRNAATQAAQRTKFNQTNSPNNQSGTITYYFNLK